MNSDTIAPIILAGGYGTFRSTDSGRFPKVLEEVAGKPMICHLTGIVSSVLGRTDPFIVTNTEIDCRVRSVLTSHGVHGHYAVQQQRMGNAGATSLCLPLLSQTPYRHCRHILVFYADMPCWRPSSIRSLIEAHSESSAALTIFQIDLDQDNCPDVIRRYGRVIRDQSGEVLGAFEPQEFNRVDTKLVARARTVNPSVYVFRRDWLEENIELLEPHDRGDGYPPEYWLPDLVGMAAQSKGEHVEILDLDDPNEALGINTPKELEEVRRVMMARAA